MIDRVRAWFVRGMREVFAHRMLATPLLLILCVPIAFLWSGQRFLDVSEGARERLEKDRIGTFHDLVGVAIHSGSLDDDTLAPLLATFMRQNPDVINIALERIEQGSSTAILSLGTALPGSYNEIIRMATLRTDESLIFEAYEGGTRYWVGVRAIHREKGELLILRTDVSMAALDRALAAQTRSAYLTAFLLVLAILLLVWRQVRMIDYARLYRDLERAHDTMSLFVNMTAHELRTPLTAIKGYASLVREESTDEKVRGYGSRVEASAENLIALIGDLLDLARLQSGKMLFESARVDLAEVVLKTVTLLSPIAAKSSLGLRTEMPHDQPFILIGDEKRLTQVLTNVISNSLKYTKEGTVTVAVSRSGQMIEIRVKDTGMGISAEDQRRLFAPYFRVASADVAKTTGTGLGMWITKQMIAEMKGTIDVESIKGVGTHIVITFKAA